MKPLTRKDLMIGDFLRYRQDFPNTHLQGRIVEIECIRGRLDVVTIDDDIVHEYVHPNWLEPIPLIPEILKKNGFSPETYDDHILVLNEKSGEVIYYECGQNYGLTIDNQYSQIRELRISYLHQLQHAFRLCGIDKEIEL